MRLPSRNELEGEGLLLGAAFLWGFSFVLQRLGMRTMGPLGFNAIRYILAALAVAPVLAATRARRSGRGAATGGISQGANESALPAREPLLRSLAIGAGSGAIMFGGASLQQMGIVHTTAGKAGFISGLYVAFVPVFSFFLGKRPPARAWIGAAIAVAGLYFLSMTEGLSMGRGDALVLAGAALWGAQIMYLDRFAARADPFALAAAQFAVVACLSLPPAIAAEGLSASSIAATALPLALSGVFAVGLGFTLQILGQRKAQATRASLVMSMESPFAAAAGAIFLGEALTGRTLLGFALIMAGVVLAQSGKRPAATSGRRGDGNTR